MAKSHGVRKSIYTITEKLPSEERFGWVIQMRRASVYIVSNIAEGSGNESEKEFLSYIEMEYSSAN
ncbi:MAG: four helix bundle protein [Bacteroidota bacterium]